MYVQIHCDEVTAIPEGFELLASSELCKVQSLVKFYPDGKDGPRLDHTKGELVKPWSRVQCAKLGLLTQHV